MKELYSQAIKYACMGNYDKLKVLLDANNTHASEVHDLVASIALKSNDRQLFHLTDNHPRILLSEYAANEELFPRLVEWYFEGGYEDRNGVPQYVWEACTLENAKILAYFTGDVPEDYISREKDVEWQMFFNYKEDSDEEEPEEEEGAVLPNPLLNLPRGFPVPTTQPAFSSPWISPVQLEPLSRDPQQQFPPIVSQTVSAEQDSGRSTMTRLLDRMKELKDAKESSLTQETLDPIPVPKSGTTITIRTYAPPVSESPVNFPNKESLTIDSIPKKLWNDNDFYRKQEIRGFILYRNEMRHAWNKECMANVVPRRVTYRALESWIALPSENKKFYIDQVPIIATPTE